MHCQLSVTHQGSDFGTKSGHAGCYSRATGGVTRSNLAVTVRHRGAHESLRIRRIATQE